MARPLAGTAFKRQAQGVFKSPLMGKKPSNLLSKVFLLCAVHGNQLDGASPLWGFVVTYH
jgi:hypothetical protein